MIRYKRHNAMRFLRIGRLQVSWVWCKPRVKPVPTANPWGRALLGEYVP